ncbi:hypothetical protein AVEN_215628-1, partial [Araneus ventricosus]
MKFGTQVVVMVSPWAFGKLCIILELLQMWTTALSEILYQCRYFMIVLMKLMFGVFNADQHHERATLQTWLGGFTPETCQYPLMEILH